MPVHVINGIGTSYEEYGAGEPVVLLTGTGARGRVWKTYQVPALTKAGFRVITVDSRGVPPTDLCEEGFTLADLIADTVALIEFLDIGPCRIVGLSLGAIIVQELLLERPELISQAVLMATRGRTDALNAAISAAELELFDLGIKLPARFDAALRVMQGFSRQTLGDDEMVRDWLDIFEMSSVAPSLSRAQRELDIIPDRLGSYRQITADCLVMAFHDDMLAPPYLGREVAEHIPGAQFLEIPDCGHFGYLERPEEVNAALIRYFRAAG
jgi:pimeloyl-ACP methyl ester carboxylesterase